jgi:hypothetical protein
LSKTNIALVLFIAILLLSIYAQIDIQSKYYPSHAIDADKLNEKPTNYFSLPNPDQYVLEAINSERFVDIRSLDDTQIDELINQYGTNNIEYNSTYYTVWIANVDSFPPFMLQVGILVGIVLSVSAIVVISLFQYCRIS